MNAKHTAAAWVTLYQARPEHRLIALRLYMQTDEAAEMLNEIISECPDVATCHRLLLDHANPEVPDICLNAGRWLMPAVNSATQAQLLADLERAEVMS